MPVWLIGMMGSGKSEVGKVLADRKGWAFVDTDHLITAEAGRDVPTIFSEEGEAGFREREQVAIKQVSGTPAAVVATGGGAILDPENVDVMRSTGLVFWLQADTAALAARLENEDLSSRPLLFESDIEETLAGILEEREQLYRHAADFVVGTDLLTVAEVADLVEALWRE
jgi:shikimate kinase